jgi:hypothetical protein
VALLPNSDTLAPGRFATSFAIEENIALSFAIMQVYQIIQYKGSKHIE